MANQTALYDLHLKLGAKMVPFAGYDMPLQYRDGMKQEHLHCRKMAGLFDVSHMAQFVIRGSGLTQLLEALLPADLEALEDDQQVYTLLLNDQGGILDDLIITRWGDDCFFVVSNAACKQQDLARFRQFLPDSVKIEVLDQHALLALQGPKAAEVMQQLSPDPIDALTFMKGCHMSLSGAECYVTRSGYTGEDGFEISVPGSIVNTLAGNLLDFEAVAPIGLGARDSLRLEAGLCLYGHDMNTETTPIEAGLTWAIAKTRRPQGTKAGGFEGATRIFEQMAQGVSRKRVGLKVMGRVPVREGASLQDGEGRTIGTVSSGGFAPSLQQPIAMAYVEHSLANIGSELQAQVRDKSYPVTIVKMPFVPQNYYRG
ncbi:MAG: glycine cleavage system aminomethyltransferase GcvT [Candidatus Porifericomitaceae bacterium WSBS_2022_MAG_OTU9]